MPSVLAIVSKAVFEKQAKGASIGTVVPFEHYASTHAALDPLAGDGALFLVTVRPPDEALWLVGVLESPRKANDGWRAGANVVAIADITARKRELAFASGKGLSAKPGALGMSLQTPRALADGDVAMLRAAVGSKSAATKPAKAAAPAKPPKVAKPARVIEQPTAGGKQAVEAALAAGDGAAALSAALAWWTGTRAPAVADLVDAISVRVSPDAVANDTDFVKLGRAKNPLDLGALLAAVPDLAASFLPTAGQVLAEFPDDPRLAIAVARWALDPMTTSSSTYPFWTKVIDAMVRAKDARVVPILKQRLAKKRGDSQFWPKFYAALERAIAKIGTPPADVAVPAALTAKLGKLSTIAARAPEPRVEDVPAPKLSGTLLEQARQHLDAGRIAAAIDAMIERWRTDRANELADLIDRATRLLPTYDLTLGPLSKKDDPWLAAFERGPMAAMPQLLQSINVGDARYGGSKLADRRLLELANLPDDPRVALRLAELASIFGVSPERTQYWKSLLEQLARIRDPRTCRPLRATFREFTNTYFDHHRQARRIIRDFAMQDPPPVILPAADRALVAEMSRAVEAAEASSLARTLVAAIAAEWNDDAPRLVYADWLVQRDHPRGEAIVIDCKRERSVEETGRRADIALGYAYIYGALDDVADIQYDHLVRGIPTQLRMRWSTGTLNWRAAAGHPLVALVETVDVGDIQRPPDAEDLETFVRAAKRLRAIERVERDRDRMLWAYADPALPGFRRERGRFVRT
jgi:uncharacterized protein (TIGR02996 family)